MNVEVRVGQVVRIERPWAGSDAGWRRTRHEVDRRVRRWRQRRLLQAWLVELPLAALGVALECARRPWR